VNSSAIPLNQAEVFNAQRHMRTYADRALLRLRGQAALNALAISLTVSAWMLVLLLFADKLFALKTLGVNVWVIWGAVSVLGLPYILWRVFSPKLHERRAAVLADDRLGLHARLSSALTLDFRDPANGPMGGAFLDEASRKLSAVRVQQAFPVRFPRAFAWLLVPALLAGAIYKFMDTKDVLGIVARAEAKRNAEKQRLLAAEGMQKQLEDLKKMSAEKPGDDKSGNYKLNQLIKDADQIAKDLKNESHDAEAEMLKMGALKSEIEKEKERIERGKEFSARLEKLTATDLNLEENDLTKNVSEALKMGDAGMAAKEMRKLAQKVKEQILNDDKKTPEEKQKALEKLQRELEKLAGAMAEDEVLRDKLQEVSKDSMSAAEFQKLEQEMKKAEEKKGKNNKKFGDDIQKEMEEAADEMERLDEENDTKLDEDEQKEMDGLDELEKSIDNALDGLNGEGEQGQQQGQRQGGQQNGQKGGKTGKAGGQKQGNGNNRGMRQMRGNAGQRGQGQDGQDGKNGRGQNGQQGDQNGNKDGRPGDGAPGNGPGQGRRPYRDGDAEFEKQKAKGELRAGAITGISHFRGQGAKGDAPKEFYKTFEAAEKENASSLELERIPADARETVKDYFTRVHDGASVPSTQPPAPVQDNTAPPTSPPAPKKNDGPAKEGLKE